MSAKLVFLPAAQADLFDLYDYIHADNPTAADQYVADLQATCEHVATFPHLGRPYDRRYFYIISRNHLIFYRYDRDQDTLTVARIIHGSRNIPDHV